MSTTFGFSKRAVELNEVVSFYFDGFQRVSLLDINRHSLGQRVSFSIQKYIGCTDFVRTKTPFRHSIGQSIVRITLHF